MSEARRIRFLALGILGAFVLFAGALFSLPWLVGDPLPVARPDGRIGLTADGPGGTVDAELQVSAARDFVLVFDLASPPAQTPDVTLTMPHQDLAADAPEIETIGGGRYRASGRLQLPGQWRVRIVAGSSIHELDFVLAEF